MLYKNCFKHSLTDFIYVVITTKFITNKSRLSGISGKFCFIEFLVLFVQAKKCVNCEWGNLNRYLLFLKCKERSSLWFIFLR